MPATGFCMLYPLACESRKKAGAKKNAIPRKSILEKPLQIKNRSINEFIFEVQLCAGLCSALMQVTNHGIIES